MKKFLLAPHEIVPLALNRGGCIATDRITVDGRPVGYMYREEGVRRLDNGWRFFAGDENPEYMNNLGNHSVYDTNTIVNYCPEILPYLDAPEGSAFERTEDGAYIPVEN